MGKGFWDYFWELFGEAFSIGLSIVGSVVAGAVCGWWIDEKLFKGKTGPWFLILGVVLGAIGGFKNFMYFSKKLSKKERDVSRDNS